MFKRLMAVLLICVMIMSAPMQVHATAVAVPLVLSEVIKDLIMSAAVTYIGYESVSSLMTTDSESYKSLQDAILAAPTVQEGLELARQWEQTEGSSALDSSYSYTGDYFRVVGRGEGTDNLGGALGSIVNRAVNVGLSAKMIKAARDAAKAWADSEAGSTTGLYMDPAIPSSISGVYSYTVNYNVHAISMYPDVSMIDALTGHAGVYAFIESNFGTDNWVLTSQWGDNLQFLVIPYDYMAVNYSVNYIKFVDYDNFNSVLNNAGYISSGNLRTSIENMMVSSDGYLFQSSGSDITEISAFIRQPALNNIHNFLAFGYNEALKNHSPYRFYGVSDGLITIDDISCDVTRPYLTYDDTKNLPVPDFWDVPVSEGDFAGLTYPSLAALVEYVKSLIDGVMDDVSSGAGGLTDAQATSILTGINNISTGISGLSGDIGDVVDAITSVPDAFSDMFLDGSALTNLVNSLPGQIADSLSDVLAFPDVAVVVDAITAIPDAFVDGLITVFPDAAAVGDAIVGVPDAIIEGIKDLVITIPEITIPDITIPEIVIPEIATPAVDVILDPAFDITVQNDYAGLGDIVSTAISAALTGLFVPDYAVTLDKVNAIHGYFDFGDQIYAAGGTMLDKLLNITPSPYLKIPLGDETSKYNYGIGDYWIIDISWYAQYKSYGDKIILAIVWGFFLWHLFLRLPGIISGTEGQIMAAHRAADKYNSKEDKYYYKNEGYGRF